MKNAIVTGATKGIGLAIAKMLLKEGYHVVATYSSDKSAADSAAAEFASISTEFEIVRANQADKAAMKEFAAAMLAKGHVDCIINNTGATVRKHLSEITDAEWETSMQVNVNSSLFLVRDLLPAIHSGSKIVFIGSMMGIYPHGTSIAYGVAKSAVHALALNLVKFFEGTGTTVNVVAPGFVETEWQKDKPQQIRNNIYDKTAIKRFASVEEIADAVKFCINNPFVNGSIIEVNGGYCFK